MADEKLLNETRCDIILALADNNMNVSEVARNIFMHRNAVAYNIERIRQITEKDPLNFYDLIDLVLFIKGGQRWQI